MRIATWNLQRPRQNTYTKNQRQIDQIHRIQADLWILTETNSAINLEPNYQAIESCPIQGYHEAGEHMVTIWSSWPISRAVPTFNPNMAVCAEVASPWGAMIVYGMVIPYANETSADGTVKRWAEHRRAIAQHHTDWLRLKQEFPQHHFCLAGDFNHNRDGTTWYGDRESIDRLTQIFQEISVPCVTEKDFRAEGLSRASIDHICLSQDLLSQITNVTAWEGKTATGELMSDHNGILVELSYS